MRHLPKHEAKMCERRCQHRHAHLHARKGSAKWIKNYRWARYWRHQIRKQMRKLYRDAHRHGGGGWHKDGRGWRYQMLGAAEKGKSCHVDLHASGNRVVGGSPRERLVLAAKRAASLSASGRRHSFYSQAGAWTVRYGITGEPHGFRSDCSQWITSIFWSAGLPDPNRNNYGGGYTGTLGAHGRKITRGQLKPGDLVLYGPFPHHHVEMYIGPGNKTIGHGSAPVDAGTIDMLGGSKTYRAYLP